MHIVGFFILAFIFGCLGSLLGLDGMVGGFIFGGLLTICIQLGDLIDFLKKSNNMERK